MICPASTWGGKFAKFIRAVAEEWAPSPVHEPTMMDGASSSMSIRAEASLREKYVPEAPESKMAEGVLLFVGLRTAGEAERQVNSVNEPLLSLATSFVRPIKNPNLCFYRCRL